MRPGGPLELPADDGGVEGGAGTRRGQHVVLKPSDTTPVTSVRLAELASEFLPPGVFNVVCGDR